MDLIRRPWRSAAGAVLLGALAAVPAVGVFEVSSPFGAVFFALLFGVAIGAAIRMARSGVTVHDGGLIVRDTVRTRRIPWNRVRYISPATDDPAFGAVGVVTAEGHVLCYALGALRFEGNPSAPRFRSLYERLDAHFQAARIAGRCPAAD